MARPLNADELTAALLEYVENEVGRIRREDGARIAQLIEELDEVRTQLERAHRQIRAAKDRVRPHLQRMNMPAGLGSNDGWIADVWEALGGD